jgi:integrase/recombinase XerD
MSDLAPIIQAFFTERLITQRQASAHTVAAYRDTIKLLLGFASHHTGKHPAQMDLADLDAPLIGAFLQHLQTERGNAVTTRNARLAAHARRADRAAGRRTDRPDPRRPPPR